MNLTPTEGVHGAVVLDNHSAVLLLAERTAKQTSLKAVRIDPAGQTIWSVPLQRSSRDQFLAPVWRRLHSTGNVTLLGEEFSETDPSLGVRKNQLLIQAIDANGQLTRKAFDMPLPEPKAEKSSFASFAHDGAFYLVTKESNSRLGTQQFWMERYAPSAAQAQAIRLDLPNPYETKPFNGSRELYTDWVFGGYKQGKCYFYRTVKGLTKTDDPEKFPTEYEVRVMSPAGQLLSQFTTAIHQQLQPNTYLYFSGLLPHYAQGEPTMTKEVYTGGGAGSYDLYRLSSGGAGEFMLDPNPDSDVCYFTGEYSNQVFARFAPAARLGTFVCQYNSAGKLLKSRQEAYTAQVAAAQKKLLAPGSLTRAVDFYLDPLTGNLQLVISDESARTIDAISVVYDRQLESAQQRYWSAPAKDASPEKSASLSLAGNTYLFYNPVKNTFRALHSLPNCSLSYLENVQTPVYENVRRLMQKEKTPNSAYWLVPTGPASAMVLARSADGNKLNVYRF